MKTLILYVFHIINHRVHYFIENAIFESEDYTFLIICNNKNIEFTCPKYVKVLKRDNIGYDFGGWSEGLINDDLYKNYDKFIFVNSSCLGPLLPSYFSGNWCDIFTNQINDEVKLFGTTINSISNITIKSHVQSWLFCTDRIGLDLLINKGIFSIKNYETSLFDAIWNREVPMSRVIINNGWNIGCLMAYYHNVDFRCKNENEYIVTGLEDVAFENKYFGGNLNPYEVIFYKDNRNINKDLIDVYHKKDILNKKINKAVYGSNNKYINVTNVINHFLGKTFKVSDSNFGDPNPLNYKHLIILDELDNVIVSWENNFYYQKYVTDNDLKSYYLDILVRY